MKGTAITTIIVLCLALAFLYYDNIKIHKTAQVNMLIAETYARANGKSLAKKNINKFPKMYLDIENEIGTPMVLLQAVNSHENGSRFISFGVKRIPEKVIKKYDPTEWQVRGASKILIQESFRLILTDKTTKNKYFERLAKRYCNGDKENWEKDVKKLYEELSK